MGNFRKLSVWQRAKDLAVQIYQSTQEGGFEKDYKMRDQIRSAAVSIAANIAEGDELQSDKQSIRHFFIARGSSAEVFTLVEIASEIGYLENDLAQRWLQECTHISGMIYRLIQARQKKPLPYQSPAWAAPLHS